MDLETLLLIFVGLMTLVFLLFRVFTPLSQSVHPSQPETIRVKATPEWQSLLGHRQEIERDPLLDEQSRSDLIQSWQEMAESSKIFVEPSSSSKPMFFISSVYLPFVFVSGVLLTSLVFMLGNNSVHSSSFEWPNFSIQQVLTPGGRPVVTTGKHPGDGSNLEAHLQNLVARLKENPSDIQGWVLLSRTQAAMSDYAASAESLRRALIILPGHPSLLADLADMLAMANNRLLAGEPYQLIQEALTNDPQHIKALALAATAAEQAGDESLATTYWERFNVARMQQEQVQSNTKNSEAADLSDQQAPANNPLIVTTTVNLSQDMLNQATPNAVLFVFVKAQADVGMPLAVVKLPVNRLVAGYLELPISAMHLLGSQTFDQLPKTLFVQARLAMSGQVSVSDQDWVSDWIQIQKGGAVGPLSFHLKSN